MRSKAGIKSGAKTFDPDILDLKREQKCLSRKYWNELLEKVMEQKVKMIIISGKDRFIRYEGIYLEARIF